MVGNASHVGAFLPAFSDPVTLVWYCGVAVTVSSVLHSPTGTGSDQWSQIVHRKILYVGVCVCMFVMQLIICGEKVQNVRRFSFPSTLKTLKYQFKSLHIKICSALC